MIEIPNKNPELVEYLIKNGYSIGLDTETDDFYLFRYKFTINGLYIIIVDKYADYIDIIVFSNVLARFIEVDYNSTTFIKSIEFDRENLDFITDLNDLIELTIINYERE